jgi:DNA-binding GntR family transcriptional regulator
MPVQRKKITREARVIRGLRFAASREGALFDRAYQELEERIVTLRLPPGAIVSEMALAKELKLGRTPVREALQRLAYEGLVAVLPRRGILVTEVNVKTQLRMLEVRREIERLMVRCACVRASDEEADQRAEIAQAMERAAKTNDGNEFMRLDRMMNTIIDAAVHNEFASKAMRLMSGLIRRFWFLYYKEVADLPLCAKLHAELARAISQRNADEAAAALDRLIHHIENFTRATLNARRVA